MSGVEGNGPGVAPTIAEPHLRAMGRRVQAFAAMALNPITANQAQGTVDANGNLAIKFQMVPPTEVWTATVSVPGASPSVRWIASVAGIPVGSFYGSSPAGPYSMPATSQLVLSAANLRPGDQYTASLQGSALHESEADSAPAAAPPATNAVSIINEEVFVAGPINDTGGGTTLVVNVPPSWSVLHFFNTFGQPAQITVTGVQTGFVYANAISILGGVAAPSIITPVLIDPSADNQVTVVIKAVGTILQSGVYITAQLNSSAFVVNNQEQPLFVLPGAPSGVGPGGLGAGLNFDVVRYGGSRHIEKTLAGAGTIAVLAAPVPGTMYALHRVVYSGAFITTAGGSGKIVGHTTAIRFSDFNCLTAVGVVNSGENLDGLLTNEGVDFTTAGGAGVCDLHYDIVAAPTVS